MDWETLLSSQRLGESSKPSYTDAKYNRSEFEKDYRRIVTSASFRRLQDKTQVFPLDKSDFVRTRLTHSVETASFAKELGDMAVQEIREKYEDKERLPQALGGIPDILMCAGLLHDVGNPPFGHFGEVVIGDWFRGHLADYEFAGKRLSEWFPPNSPEFADLCHFEGNAQALRVLAKLHLLDSDNGMNLTAALLNTVIKYPCASTQIRCDGDIKHHKMGYFWGDREVFNQITALTGTRSGNQSACRHPLTFLLEAADDIAYATADLEDGYKKGMFSVDELSQFLLGEYEKCCKTQHPSGYQKRFTKDLLDMLLEVRNHPKSNSILGTDRKIEKEITDVDLFAMQNWVGYVQSWLTYCAFVGFRQNYDAIMAGTYEKDLLFGTNQQYSMDILKAAMGRFVFQTPKIVKLELGAETILSSLLEKFVRAVIYYDYVPPEGTDEKTRAKRCQSKADVKITKLLSANYVENYRLEVRGITDQRRKLYHRLLLVTDYLSGMTDSYAKNLYQELNGIY